MLKEILENLNESVEEKRVIKFKDIFDTKYKDIESIKNRFSLNNIVTDEKLIDAIEYSLKEFLDNISTEIDEIAIPQEIIVTHNTIILNDWVLYIGDDELIPSEDDINTTIGLMEELQLDDVVSDGENINVKITLSDV